MFRNLDTIPVDTMTTELKVLCFSVVFITCCSLFVKSAPAPEENITHMLNTSTTPKMGTVTKKKKNSTQEHLSSQINGNSTEPKTSISLDITTTKASEQITTPVLKTKENTTALNLTSITTSPTNRSKEKEIVLSTSPTTTKSGNITAKHTTKSFQRTPVLENYNKTAPTETTTSKDTNGNKTQIINQDDGKSSQPSSTTKKFDKLTTTTEKNNQVTDTVVQEESTKPKTGQNLQTESTTKKLEKVNKAEDTQIEGRNPSDEVSNNDGSKPMRTDSSYSDEESTGGHFMAYFMTFVVICIAGYVIYHNKQKILAFLLEGRKETGSRRRPNSKEYKRLKTEEVMPSLEKNTSDSKYIY